MQVGNKARTLASPDNFFRTLMQPSRLSAGNYLTVS